MLRPETGIVERDGVRAVIFGSCTVLCDADFFFFLDTTGGSGERETVGFVGEAVFAGIGEGGVVVTVVATGALVVGKIGGTGCCDDGAGAGVGVGGGCDGCGG